MKALEIETPPLNELTEAIVGLVGSIDFDMPNRRPSRHYDGLPFDMFREQMKIGLIDRHMIGLKTSDVDVFTSLAFVMKKWIDTRVEELDDITRKVSGAEMEEPFALEWFRGMYPHVSELSDASTLEAASPLIEKEIETRARYLIEAVDRVTADAQESKTASNYLLNI